MNETSLPKIGILLFITMACMSACDSGVSGGDAPSGNPSMNSTLDGKAWADSNGEVWFTRDTVSAHASKLIIIGFAGATRYVYMGIGGIAADSFQVSKGGKPGMATFGYRDGTTDYISDSGYVKITKVSDNGIEGRFACRLLKVPDTTTQLRFREGNFIATYNPKLTH